MFIKIAKSQRGDTIVEVLLALVVLMVIIGGGYSIATRSLRGIRMSQERSEATKIAEGQIEAINQRLSQHPTLSELGSDPNRGTYIGYDGASWNALYGSGYSDSSICIKGDGVGVDSAVGTSCTIDGLYGVSIRTGIERLNFNPTNLALDKKQLTYTVTVSWERVGGGNVPEQVVMTSRYIL